MAHLWTARYTFFHIFWYSENRLWQGGVCISPRAAQSKRRSASRCIVRAFSAARPVEMRRSWMWTSQRSFHFWVSETWSGIVQESCGVGS